MSEAALPIEVREKAGVHETPVDASERDSARPAQPPFMARRRHTLLARTVGEEIIPRLILAQRLADREAAVADTYGGDVQELTDLVLQPRFDMENRQVAAVSGRQMGTEAVYLDLLAPTARRLGEMWEDDLCDFVQVTVGLIRLQQILTTFSAPLENHPRQSSAPRILLIPTPGDQHTFGMSMVASFFQRAGWNGWTGVPSSTGEMLARVRAEWFAVVGFSVADGKRLDVLATAIRAVRKASRNREVGIMVGGPIFIEHPELVAMVGADTTASDGQQAVLQARLLLSLIPTRGQ